MELENKDAERFLKKMIKKEKSKLTKREIALAKKVIKNVQWFEVQFPEGKQKEGHRVWVKGKEGLEFHKERLKDIKEVSKILQPRILYSSECDMFSINWGSKEIASTIECKNFGGIELRFDITREGVIVGVEIDDFSQALDLYNCDKEKNLKRIKVQYIRRRK